MLGNLWKISLSISRQDKFWKISISIKELYRYRYRKFSKIAISTSINIDIAKKISENIGICIDIDKAKTNFRQY